MKTIRLCLAAFLIAAMTLSAKYSQLYKDYKSADLEILKHMTIEEAVEAGIENDELNRLVAASAYADGMTFEQFQTAAFNALDAFNFPEGYSKFYKDLAVVQVLFNNKLMLQEAYSYLKLAIAAVSDETHKKTLIFYLGYFYAYADMLKLSDREKFDILTGSLSCGIISLQHLDYLIALLSGQPLEGVEDSEIYSVLDSLNKRYSLYLVEQNDQALKSRVIKLRILKGLYK